MFILSPILGALLPEKIEVIGSGTMPDIPNR
jgi:hypothetical protein